MMIQVSDIVPVFIIFQSLLFAVVLLTDNGPKRISNRFLAAFLLVLGLQFVTLARAMFNIESTFLDASVCVYGFIYGPLLFFYTRTLIYRTFQFRKSMLLHLIPAAFFLFFAALGRSLCSPFGALLYFSLVSYITMAVREMVRYRKVIKDTQSSNAHIDLKWLQWTVLIFSFALCLDMVDQFLFPMDIVAGISSIHLSILILINWIFYKGLKQPQIFLGISKSDEMLTKKELDANDQDFPSDDELEELDRIKEFMQNSKVYTHAELSLTELASMLDLPPRKLSYLINSKLNQNFMGFVNHYRIEMAKERLTRMSDSGETILEVMYEVGFNSKSSFNTLFKQSTGFTPSDFRKKHINR
jgi:AraC-like DNA-binding protein